MSTKSNIESVLRLILLGALVGGMTGALLLVLRVFTDPITEIFCALAGALVVPSIVYCSRDQKKQEAEKLDAEHRTQIEEEKSHDIAATCLTSFDFETRELSYSDPDFKTWIDAHRQPDGSICRSGEVIELWWYTIGSPMAEVKDQITRGRSARWMGNFNNKQVVAILAE